MGGRARSLEGRPALVFLHGFALDARMWRRQVEAFANDHSVMTVDLPGFGPQARDLGEVEPATELRRAMETAGLARAHLVGMSFGAAVAVDFALAYPGRVQSLVLIAPMLLSRRLGIDAWSRCVDLANEGDKTTAAEVWLDDALFETLRQDEELFEEVRQIVLDYGGGHWSGRVTSSFHHPDPVPALKELQIPTLVLSGEADIPSFMLMAEAYAKTIPNARREIVQGVGHHASLEAPGHVNELIRAFYKTLS
jgi:3-oxoadipate enol-lactonase